MRFEQLPLSSETLYALNKMNIITPTEIQEQVIPILLSEPHSHVLAQAKTGTGKTLAFSIPVVEHLDPQLRKIQAVVIVPTRELCKQVAEVISELSQFKKLSIVQVYGGVSINRQIEKIKRGAQIVVATPGRLIDLYDRGEIDFDYVKYVVLDEADRCLDMGFFPDIEYILHNAMHNSRPYLLLFSATLLDEVQELAKTFTREEKILKFNVSEDELTVENCDQYYYLIPEFKDKYYHFIRILRKEKPKHSIIFVNTKKTAEWLYSRILQERNLNINPEIISGNLSQRKREIVIKKFKEHKINALIATDVAARGLDLPHITHVFNYDLPDFAENYVHRIGRTARISRDGKPSRGTAISLVLEKQYKLLARIEGFSNTEIKERPLPPRSSYRYGRREGTRSLRNNRSQLYQENKEGNTFQASFYNKKERINKDNSKRTPRRSYDNSYRQKRKKTQTHEDDDRTKYSRRSFLY